MRASDLAVESNLQRVFLISASLSVLLVVGTPAASAGSLKVCRTAGVTNAYTGKNIQVPVGFLFLDTGHLGRDDEGITRPTTFIVTTPGIIGARQQCATVSATASIHGTYSVGPHDGRRYGNQQAGGPMDDTQAFPVSQFQ